MHTVSPYRKGTHTKTTSTLQKTYTAPVLAIAEPALAAAPQCAATHSQRTPEYPTRTAQAPRADRVCGVYGVYVWVVWTEPHGYRCCVRGTVRPRGWRLVVRRTRLGRGRSARRRWVRIWTVWVVYKRYEQQSIQVKLNRVVNIGRYVTHAILYTKSIRFM